MPLIIANLNPTDRVRVGRHTHVLGIKPPVPTYAPAINGGDILLSNAPSDQELHLDNLSGVFRKRLTTADLLSVETAPLNVDLLSFKWGVFDTGERHGDILILNSGGWLASDQRVNDTPGNTITYVSELIHSDGTTVLWSETGPTVPADHRFDIGDQLHATTVTLRVSATYDDDGTTTVETLPILIPAYAEPPNLWLSMLNDEETSNTVKGAPLFTWSFDDVTGDVTLSFPEDDYASLAGSPRIGIGGSLNSNLLHTISFELHAASEREADLLTLVTTGGSEDGGQGSIPLFSTRPPLVNGFCTITGTYKPTESGNFRFDMDTKSLNADPAVPQDAFVGTAILEIKNVEIRET